LVPSLTSTFPVFSSVAVGLHIAVVRLPVELNVPAEGLYSSALETHVAGDKEFSPPTIRTSPLGSSAAAWYMRPVLMLPVELNVPVEGL
jgi:hypothetical protein